MARMTSLLLSSARSRTRLDEEEEEKEEEDDDRVPPPIHDVEMQEAPQDEEVDQEVLATEEVSALEARRTNVESSA